MTPALSSLSPLNKWLSRVFSSDFQKNHGKEQRWIDFYQSGSLSFLIQTNSSLYNWFSSLLLGRIPLSHLDLIKPSISTKLKEKQFQQKNFDVHAKQRSFKVGDSVFVRDLPARKDWLAGIITSVNGRLSSCDVRRW